MLVFVSVYYTHIIVAWFLDVHYTSSLTAGWYLVGTGYITNPIRPTRRYLLSDYYTASATAFAR